MDVSPLITFLAPCLGFLLDAGRSAAGEKLGAGMWENARRLWARLGPAIAARPAAAEAAADVAASPDDELARCALAWQLEKVLEDDPALAEDVRALWADAEKATVSVTAGRDIVGSTIVIGDRNRLGGRS